MLELIAVCVWLVWILLELVVSTGVVWGIGVGDYAGSVWGVGGVVVVGVGSIFIDVVCVGVVAGVGEGRESAMLLLNVMRKLARIFT